MTTGAAALALGLWLGLAGCGGHAADSGIASASSGKPHSSAGASPTPSQDRSEQVLAFARCMRAHGVNMPDPVTDNGRLAISIPRGTNPATLEAAQKACRQYLPNGGVPPSMSPQQLAQLRKYAECMRQHGVDMPDPDPAGGGLRLKNVNPDSPAFKAAEQACRALNPLAK